MDIDLENPIQEQMENEKIIKILAIGDTYTGKTTFFESLSNFDSKKKIKKTEGAESHIFFHQINYDQQQLQQNSNNLFQNSQKNYTQNINFSPQNSYQQFNPLNTNKTQNSNIFPINNNNSNNKNYFTQSSQNNIKTYNINSETNLTQKTQNQNQNINENQVLNQKLNQNLNQSNFQNSNQNNLHNLNDNNYHQNEKEEQSENSFENYFLKQFYQSDITKNYLPKNRYMFEVLDLSGDKKTSQFVTLFTKSQIKEFQAVFFFFDMNNIKTLHNLYLWVKQVFYDQNSNQEKDYKYLWKIPFFIIGTKLDFIGQKYFDVTLKKIKNFLKNKFICENSQDNLVYLSLNHLQLFAARKLL